MLFCVSSIQENNSEISFSFIDGHDTHFCICWALSRSLAYSTFLHGHIFSTCHVCSIMQGNPGMGGGRGILASRKACYACWEGDEGAPCPSWLAFKGLSTFSPDVPHLCGEWAWLSLWNDDLTSLSLLSWKFSSEG